MVVSELEVRRILFRSRYPTIADQKSLEVPRCDIWLLVMIKDVAGKVRNMLTSVGFARDVKLQFKSVWFYATEWRITYIVIYVFREKLKPLLQERNQLIRHVI